MHQLCRLNSNCSKYRFLSVFPKNSQCILPNAMNFKDKMFCSTIGIVWGIGVSFAAYKCVSNGIPWLSDFLPYHPHLEYAVLTVKEYLVDGARWFCDFFDHYPKLLDVATLLYGASHIGSVTYILLMGFMCTVSEIKSSTKCCRIIKISGEYVALAVLCMVITFILYEVCLKPRRSHKE